MEDARNCEHQVEKMLKDPQRRQDKSPRSLSPWEYCIHRDVNRVPHEISVAMCLCQGCVINQDEDASYNSVPVCGQMMVLWRMQCPHDPNKYVVKKEVISIPVACTCVKPVYSK
ncbi:interleukin-17C-like [Leuresthes tenuis]|uniref:interleukin-17C-like n=1 Tax=Leuresthes tenuis TaxID=355514 RepID=UPI003B500BE3